MNSIRVSLISGILLLIILLLALLGVMTGVSQISPYQVIGIVLENLAPELFTNGDTVTWQKSQALIINELRAPRVILAIFAGAGLAVTGAALQAATRNPLTDPFLLGVSSGASMGAVLVISHTGMLDRKSVV